jgi:CubicO group peptidase (beta-lactamase class C family)
MRVGIIGLRLSVLLTLLSACRAPAPVASAFPVTRGHQWSDADIETLSRRLDSLRQVARIPGLSVALIESGRVVLSRGFGFANVERGVPATDTTPYDIASVSKPLSAVVALRLVELGQLDLDRPMASFAGFAEFCQEVHRVGGVFFGDYDCAATALTLRRVLSMTGNGAPGTRFLYNPPAYSWTSRPMAEVTGKAFSALVADFVFGPAAMRRSARIHRRLSLTPELAAALATPYHLDAAGRLVVSEPPPPQGDGAAGGVISTVADLARFDLALDAGRLLTSASRAAMWTPTTGPDGQPFPYGLGWFVRTVRGERLVWHTGLWEGAYSALYLKVPARGVTLILLANSDGLRFPTPLDGATIETSPFAMALLDALRP